VTKFEGTARIVQLLECCDKQLQKDLTRNAGGTLCRMTEVQILKAINKNLSHKRGKHQGSEGALHNMKKERNEPLCAFRVRLRGHTSACKFIQ